VSSPVDEVASTHPLGVPKDSTVSEQCLATGLSSFNFELLKYGYNSKMYILYTFWAIAM